MRWWRGQLVPDFFVEFSPLASGSLFREGREDVNFKGEDVAVIDLANLLYYATRNQK